MPFTRRKFLKSGAAAVLAAGLVLRAGPAAFGQDKKRPDSDSAHGFRIPYEAQQDPVFFYTRATFEPYVGGVFTTRGLGGGTVELTLLAVHDWNQKSTSKTKRGVAASSSSAAAPRTDCFSLLFRASGELPELSTIYRLEHGALGSFDLFMTASKGEHGELLYEAVINHLIQ